MPTKDEAKATREEIADRIQDIARRFREGEDRETASADLFRVVFTYDLPETPRDALALQCLAMDLAKMLVEGIIPGDYNQATHLMRWSMQRVGMFLENASGHSMESHRFQPPPPERHVQ